MELRPVRVHRNTDGPLVMSRIVQGCKKFPKIYEPPPDLRRPNNDINHELNELIGNADIVRFIKSRRMAWLGHVMRMDGGRMPRRILEWKPMCRRIRGRPRER